MHCLARPRAASPRARRTPPTTSVRVAGHAARLRSRPGATTRLPAIVDSVRSLPRSALPAARGDRRQRRLARRDARAGCRRRSTSSPSARRCATLLADCADPRRLRARVVIAISWVVDKENGGKADASTPRVNASRYPYVCAIDADAILEEDALLRVARPIWCGAEVVVRDGAGSSASRTAARSRAAGARRPAAAQPAGDVAGARVLPRVPHRPRRLEPDERASHHLEGVRPLPAVCLVVDASAGSSADGREDMELVRPDAPPPSGAGASATGSSSSPTRCAGRRRRRRCGSSPGSGAAGSAVSARRSSGTAPSPANGRYGALGTAAVPYFLLFEFLGPLIELFGLPLILVSWVAGDLSPVFLVGFFVVAMLLGVLLSLAALLLEEHSFRRTARAARSPGSSASRSSRTSATASSSRSGASARSGTCCAGHATGATCGARASRRPSRLPCRRPDGCVDPGLRGYTSAHGPQADRRRGRRPRGRSLRLRVPCRRRRAGRHDRRRRARSAVQPAPADEGLPARRARARGHPRPSARGVGGGRRRAAPRHDGRGDPSRTSTRSSSREANGSPTGRSSSRPARGRARCRCPARTSSASTPTGRSPTPTPCAPPSTTRTRRS